MNTSVLVPNWKRVITRSWSLWFILLAAALSGMEATLAHLPDGLELAPGTYALLSVGISAAAWVARLLAQKSLNPEASS